MNAHASANAARATRVLADLTQTAKGVAPAPNALANMSRDELLAMVAALSAAPAKRVSCKVSEKGALSIYGLGRFPITLYISQFDALVTNWDMIATFVEANRSAFASKA